MAEFQPSSQSLPISLLACTHRIRSPFNDEIHSSDYWSPIYDGRAIIGPIHEQFLAGASLEECKKKLNGETAINTWA